MINTNDILAAERIIGMVSEVGDFIITAKPSTDLAALEAVTPSGAAVSSAPAISELSVVSAINEMTSRKNLSGVYEHDGVLEVIVDKAWSVINQRSVVTRDRAIPMAMAIVDSLNKIYNLSFNEAGAFNIVELAPPEALSSDLGVSLIDKYATSTYPRITVDASTIILPNAPDQEEHKLDQSLVDLFITNYKDRLPGVFDNFELVELIKMVFTLPSASLNQNANYETANIYLSRLAILDLLLSCDTLPEFISGYATSITNFLNGEAAFYAKQLFLVDSYSAKQLTNKALISNVSWDSYILYVNANVYKSWMDMGGDVEALIGYVYAGGEPSKAYDSILDNITGYKEQYQIAKLKQCEIIESEQLMRFKKNLPYQFDISLTNDGFDRTSVDGILQAMRNDIANISSATGDRFYMSILKIIDMHVFPGNSVFDMALSMNRIASKIPGISPDQASRMTVTNMVIDWVVSQLDISAA